MNLASILLKSIIANCDMDTWADCEKHYFPSDYEDIWNTLNRYVQNHNKLPSFDEINISLRDGALRERFASIEKAELMEVEGKTLLEYLKNEFTQLEIMSHLEKYLEETIAIESAEDNIEALQSIVIEVADKVDLKDPAENMRKMNLFRSEEELGKSMRLGLNRDYDDFETFSSSDLVMIGGKKGGGKSATCCNIAANTYESGHSVMYFTIEMPARDIMQRCSAIASGVPLNLIRSRNLSITEWQQIAQWWSTRFEEGDKIYLNYLKHRNFDKFHQELTVKPLKEVQLDIIYNPRLTLGNIRTELDKKVNSIKPRVVIVDYVNQVKRGLNIKNRMGQYDWTEQIEVNKALKTFAQEYEVLMVTPYQIDSTGEARFAKGLLDAPDAAFTIQTHAKEDNIITFKCVKMRNNEERDFTSTYDRLTLKIGPNSGEIPKKGALSEDAMEDII